MGELSNTNQNFIPQPVYPYGIDTDYTLFNVKNTTESFLSSDNFAWAETIYILPYTNPYLVEDPWPDNGFATLDGELLYYNNVDKEYSTGKVIALRNCIRNLGGETTHYNKAGTPIRGFVVAEHHNQLVKAILNLEKFIGIDFDTDQTTLDWKIRNLFLTPPILDDYGCPEINFTFTILENNANTGIVVSYNLEINGVYTSFTIDFGDGDSTSSSTSGTKTYSPASNIDPVVTVLSARCSTVQTALQRTNPTEPRIAQAQPTLNLTIPACPAIPNFSIPNPNIPNGSINLPPIVFPCIEIPSNYININVPSLYINVPSIISLVPTIPSVISFTPLNIPSVISFTPLNIPSIISFTNLPVIPSIISFVGSFTIPSIISFTNPNIPSIISITPPIPSVISISPPIPSIISIDPPIPSVIIIDPPIPSIITFLNPPNIPSLIEFGDAPPLGPVEFGDPPPIPPVEFGDAPPLGPIEFGDPPALPTSIPITYGGGVPTSIPITGGNTIPTTINVVFGSPPTVSVNWGTPPQVTCTVNIVCPSSALYAAKSAKTKFEETATEINYDDLNLQMNYDTTGIPNEINLIVPEIKDIQVLHDIPEYIQVQVPEINDIKIRLEDELPREIRIINDLPSIITVDAGNMPNTIYLKTENLPSVIKLESDIELPCMIKFDVGNIPQSISITGIPDFIEIKGNIPNEINLKMPENPEIEMVYKGSPIEVKVELDYKKIIGDENGEDYPCFAIIPCKNKR